MPFEHGSGSHFAIDDSVPAAQTISQYVTNVDGFPEEVRSHEVTTFGNAAVKRFAGLKDLRFTIAVIYDKAVDDILAPIIGLIGTYEYGPQGSTTGDVEYTGEALCQSGRWSDPVGDMITGTWSFERDGAGTRTTFP